TILSLCSRTRLSAPSSCTYVYFLLLSHLIGFQPVEAHDLQARRPFSPRNGQNPPVGSREARPVLRKTRSFEN
ncbi:hypothetical protein DFH09DRAFT_1184417, partial [Mycena vulgaris]